MIVRLVSPMLALWAVAAGAAAPIAVPAGPPRRCIQIIGIERSTVRDDRTIDFVMRDRTVYRNSLPASCPELGFERAFSYETSLSVLCDVDIITVLRPSGPIRRGASCGLGAFQPVTLPR